MFDRRLQILIDDERHERILRASRERGVSVATVVREAIDRGLPRPEKSRRSAAARLLEAPDMPVPGVEGLRAEIDGLRGRHAA